MVFPPPNESGGEANVEALSAHVGDVNAFLGVLAGLLLREPLLARLLRVQK